MSQKKTDVKLTVSPLPGVTPIGISLNFSVGAIPVCLVDFAPGLPSAVKIEPGVGLGVLQNPDQYKRLEEIDVDINVKSRTGSGSEISHSLKWKGLLDGINLSNNIGGNTYQAVLKGKAQTLLELTTMTPGLIPGSIDIYKNPYTSFLLDCNSGPDNAYMAWSEFSVQEGLNLETNPLDFYVKLMGKVIEDQLGKYSQYLGKEETVYESQVLEKLFTENRYQKALQKGKDLIDKIDISAVQSGTIMGITTASVGVGDVVKDYFFSGPPVILENLMNFLNFLGCTLVFGSEKIWVVPERSFIKQQGPKPGEKEESTLYNAAYPADYNGYNYSDNGYKDTMAVVLSQTVTVGGVALASIPKDPALVGFYKDENELTNASGVLVLPDHPFALSAFNNNANPTNSKEFKNKADGDESYMPEPKKYGDNETKEAQSQKADENKEEYVSTLSPSLNNYAEIKFYQARYGDRRGSINLSFNPNWIPGTAGTLFVRETGFNLDFWVESVTHRIDVSPPAGGSAMTIVNFCCGRMGTSPVGVESDKFLGYDRGMESSVQSAFVSDIGGN
jgi:hypothetical protein